MADVSPTEMSEVLPVFLEDGLPPTKFNCPFHNSQVSYGSVLSDQIFI